MMLLLFMQIEYRTQTNRKLIIWLTRKLSQIIKHVDKHYIFKLVLVSSAWPSNQLKDSENLNIQRSCDESALARLHLMHQAVDNNLVLQSSQIWLIVAIQVIRPEKTCSRTVFFVLIFEETINRQVNWC